MSELFQKVVPYEYNYLCDACKSGMMKATGEQDGVNFAHKCMICSAEKSLAKSYPHIEYFSESEQPEAS